MIAKRVPGLVIGVAMGGVGLLVAAAAVGVVRQSLSLSLDRGALNPLFLLMLLPFAAWSYLLRIVRWHSLIQRLVPGVPLVVSGYSQVVGFAFAASPGRIAELYKLKLLERAVRLPVAQSLPAALVERLTDFAAFGLLVVVGGLFNWSRALLAGPASLVSLGALGAIAILAAGCAGRHHPLPRWLASVIWKPICRLVEVIPGLHRFATILELVRDGGSKVTTPSALILALACVTLGRLGDSIVLWQISHAVGYPVPFTLALIMIGSSGLIGGVTLSPGGFGATEAALVGFIAARGAPLGAAMVTALGARALIFWVWVILGLLVFAVSHGRQLAGAIRLIPRQAPAKE